VTDAPGTAGPVSHLGPEWVLGTDGLRFRRAARVILLDPADRVLLVRGHDVDAPDRTWWFTVGGGIDPGETSRDAAAREVLEETGLVVRAADLEGPVLTRSAVFDFVAEHCRQDEDIYLHRLTEAPGEGDELSRAGWTALESDVLDELRWWDLADLAAVTDEVFPADLAMLVGALLPGWDGVTRHLDGVARHAGPRTGQ